MSGKIKILGLVLAAALAVLFAGISPGTPVDDPCGGHYVGTGLKAMFLSEYGIPDPQNPGSTITFNSNITNDIPGVYYQYMVPGGDCVFLFKAGHVIVGIDKLRSNRYVAMQFDNTPGDGTGCTPPYFMVDGIGINYERAGTFTIKLINEFIASEGSGEHSGLVLTPTGARLNFGAMQAGQTAYCDMGVSFALDGDANVYAFNSQAKVSYGLVDGVLRWEVTPIHEDYWIHIYVTKKVGKKIVVVTDDWTLHETSLDQSIRSDTCPGGYDGTFYFPFKLILERLL
ncbi:MAG: hypothetical protein OEW18_12920 [Candidatus Aminicenantes bacterium]|nr:hypothetical protein [Candidatus Aminicenantes bacterium]